MMRLAILLALLAGCAPARPVDGSSTRLLQRLGRVTVELQGCRQQLDACKEE